MVKNPRQLLHVEVSLLIHATEDSDKVLKAAKNIFPEASAESIEFEKSDLKGYYKNPITMLKVCIKEKSRTTAFVKDLIRRLEADDRILLSSELEKYIDSKKTLYVRLDKQEALFGNIKLSSNDSAHVKIKFNFIPRTLEELESIL